MSGEVGVSEPREAAVTDSGGVASWGALWTLAVVFLGLALGWPAEQAPSAGQFCSFELRQTPEISIICAMQDELTSQKCKFSGKISIKMY